LLSILSGSDKTEPATTNPTEKWRNMEKEKPYQDYKTYRTPINGVPDKAKIE